MNMDQEEKVDSYKKSVSNYDKQVGEYNSYGHIDPVIVDIKIYGPVSYAGDNKS